MKYFAMPFYQGLTSYISDGWWAKKFHYICSCVGHICLYLWEQANKSSGHQNRVMAPRSVISFYLLPYIVEKISILKLVSCQNLSVCVDRISDIKKVAR